MAHFVAFDEKRLDPLLPKGDEPRPEDEAEDEDTRSTPLTPTTEEARPDSLLLMCSWLSFDPVLPVLTWTPLDIMEPLAMTIPERLSREGVGEAAVVTRAPVW